MKTIFVSSTFKDMHYERDAIREITAPALNSVAREYGDELDFCDLRWGINTGDLDTEEGSKKVLDVCLDEIDRCEPPMVVLLGYRYGWIPEADLIKSAADRKMLELEDLERSVTALEIEYGALCDDKKFKNTLFYFREIEGDVPSDYLAEDDEHAEKIAALKNRIKDITGRKVRDYTLTWNGSGFDGVDAFARILAEDIQAMLMPGWKETENLTPFQRERRSHWTFIREKNIMFRARHTEAEKLIKDALSQPVTIIKGDVGSGKSTLFSHMAAELENTEWMLLPFISGLTLESNSARDIIENTVFFIEEELKLEHYINEIDPKTNEKKKHTPDEWRDKLAEMCSAYAKTGKKLLIMLDAADQLTQSEERDKLHFIPTSVSENIHFVMTCTTDFKTPGGESYTLRELNDEDKQDVISGILARSGRELSKAVINKMLGLKASDNPLYLSLLVQRLLMMNNKDFKDIRRKGDGMAAIEQHQLNLIEKECPDALDEMSAALLNEAGKRINEKLVSKAAQYLAVSRNGLRKKDLAALLGQEWTGIDFSHFVNYMNDCFMLRDDGRYDFTHKSIRAGFYRQCEDLNKVETINREIFEYFKSLITFDIVRMKEIVYHTIKADDKKFFIDCIITYKYHIWGSYKDQEVSGLFSDEENEVIVDLVKGPVEYRIYELHRKYATQDTYTQCMIDNGKWMIDVLEEAKKYEFGEKLMHLYYFCVYHLYKAFDQSRKEIDISISVLTANALFSEYLCNKLEFTFEKKNLPDSYDKLANIYQWEIKESGKWKYAQEQALKYCLKSLSMRKRLAAEADELGKVSELSSINSKLADNYSSAAILYEAIDGNLEHALEFYQKRLTLEEQDAGNYISHKKSLVQQYHFVAEKYEEAGGRENLEHALELYRKGFAICEEFAEDGQFIMESDSVVPGFGRTLQSASYIRAGLIYEKLGGSENIDRALEMYQKTIEINRQRINEPDTVKSREWLITAYNKAGDIYVKFDGRENLERALEFYQDGLALSNELADELGSAQSKERISISYERIADTYVKIGGTENYEYALEMYQKGIVIREQLANEHEFGFDSAGNKEALFTGYIKTADTYVKLGGTENLKHSLELYENGLIIGRQLAEESNAANIKKVLFLNYLRAAHICEKFSGTEDLEHALELYRNGLTLCEEPADNSDSANNQIRLYVSYIRIAGIYVKLGGIENLERALELHQKGLSVMQQLADEHQQDILWDMELYMELDFYQESELYQGLDLYKTKLDILQQLADESASTDNKRALAVCCDDVAKIYANLGGDDNLQQALKLYQKNLAISERLNDELGTAESKRELSISYYNVARIHENLGSRDNLERALELYRKDLAISELLAEELGTTDSKRELSISYYNAARIYANLGGDDNLQQALKLYQKDLALSEQLAEELGTTDSKRNLSISYNRVAGIHGKLGGRNNLEHALTLYRKDLAIRERLADELGTADSKKNLAFGYEWVASILEKFDSNDNLKQALELYQKALAILEQLAEELATTDNIKNLAVCYHKVAGILEKLDDNDNLKQALELYRKGLTIFKQLAEELGTADSIRNLAISYEGVAGIYEDLGSSDNLERALELYNKGFTIKQQLAGELNTDKSKKDLSVSYNNVAGILEKIGGNDNLARALELYQKSLAIREQLAVALETVDTYDDLAVSLLKIAKHPSTAESDKEAFLTRSLEISKDLYVKTNLNKYKTYITECEELLQN